jgi:hypothetical protein
MNRTSTLPRMRKEKKNLDSSSCINKVNRISTLLWMRKETMNCYYWSKRKKKITCSRGKPISHADMIAERETSQIVLFLNFFIFILI